MDRYRRSRRAYGDGDIHPAAYRRSKLEFPWLCCLLLLFVIPTSLRRSAAEIRQYKRNTGVSERVSLKLYVHFSNASFKLCSSRYAPLEECDTHSSERGTKFKTPARYDHRVEYHLNDSNLHDSNLGLLESFLFGVRSHHRGDTSVVVLLSKPPANDGANDVHFNFTVGSRMWWKIRLASAGFGPTIATVDTLSAKLLDKTRCGCMCSVTKRVRLPQTMESFIDEFDLKLSRVEIEKLSYLRQDRMDENTYNSCALVFSSGVLNMISPPLGKYIDSHDAVIRINAAPAGGRFSDIAGDRTTMRVMFVPAREQRVRLPTSKMYDEGHSTLMLSVHFEERARTILEYDVRRKGGVLILPTEMRAAGSSCLFGKFYETPINNQPPRGPHLSQGMVGLLVSLHMCRKTVIFGKPFGMNKDEVRWIPRHYFENVTAGFYARVHGEREELRVLQKLRNSGTISIVPDFVH
jgi:hypothetical protein